YVCASGSSAARPCSTPMRRNRSGCCACATSGHPAAAPPTSVMNSRRLTDRPLKQRVLPYHAVGCIVHDRKFWLPMSALGQKQTLQSVRPMSALPPKADMDQRGCDVRFVPKADIRHGRLERPKFFLVVVDDDTTRAVPGQSYRIVRCGAKNSRPGNQRDLFGTHALLVRAGRRN